MKGQNYYPSNQVYNGHVTTITKFTEPINANTAKKGNKVKVIKISNMRLLEKGIPVTPTNAIINEIQKVNNQEHRGFSHFIDVTLTGGSRKTRRKCSRKRLKQSRRH
jgi:hypothetical protein